MFARIISIRLKPNSLAEFTQLIEKEILRDHLPHLIAHSCQSRIK